MSRAIAPSQAQLAKTQPIELRELRFKNFARQNPPATALVDTESRSWSRSELQQQANRLAHALLAAGLRTGDRVALVAPNCAEYLIVYLATMQLGLYFVTVNWHLSRDEVAYILRDSEAKVVIAHARYCKLVYEALKDCDTTGKLLVSIGQRHEAFIALDRLIGEQPSDATPERPHGRVMLYTSATTGKPKAVSLPLSDSDKAIDGFLAFQLRRGFEVENNSVQLCASMLYHVGPLNGAGAGLHLGHKIVLLDRWEPERILELIETHRVTSAFMVPSMFVQLLKLPAAVRMKYDHSSLRSVTHGAAPCPVEVKKQMIAWWGPILWELYGATEGSGTAVDSIEWLKFPGTVGRPITGSKIKIFDDDGNELPPGQVGTIYMTRFTGDRFEYKGDPEKTRAAYRGDFFTAGDIGYINEEGYLFVTDRKVDMIICGGMNVYPAEIESVLVLHPKVADCAVFGVPDANFGEAIRAAVQPMKGITGDAALRQEISHFLSQRLSGIKQPRYIDFTEQLPRDAAGKLRKRLLREPYWANAQRPI